jgi:hypothetical protein
VVVPVLVLVELVEALPAALALGSRVAEGSREGLALADCVVDSERDSVPEGEREGSGDRKVREAESEGEVEGDREARPDAVGEAAVVSVCCAEGWAHSASARAAASRGRMAA